MLPHSWQNVWRSIRYPIIDGCGALQILSVIGITLSAGPVRQQLLKAGWPQRDRRRQTVVHDLYKIQIRPSIELHMAVHAPNAMQVLWQKMLPKADRYMVVGLAVQRLKQIFFLIHSFLPPPPAP